MTNLKINKVMTVEELLMPRYKVIADYPHNPYKVGDLLEEFTNTAFKLTVTYNGNSMDETQANTYPASAIEKMPHLFRKLNWWEERTLDELMSVNYVRITIYTGYWRVGDVVNVTDYKIDTKNKKLEKYILDGTRQSIPERCEPATLEEYKADEIKRKTC